MREMALQGTRWLSCLLYDNIEVGSGAVIKVPSFIQEIPLMAITTSSILRITIFQTYQLQQVLNVFHAKQTAGAASDTALEVLRGFWDEIKNDWQNAMPNNAAMSTYRILLEDLVAPHDFADYSIPTGERSGARTVSGNLLNSFSAASVKITTATREVRPGGKRITGLSEDIVDGQLLAGSYVTLLNTLFSTIEAGWDALAPGSGSYDVGVYGVGRPAAPPLKFRQMNGFEVSPYVSSQVSRKIGRGS